MHLSSAVLNLGFTRAITSVNNQRLGQKCFAQWFTCQSEGYHVKAEDVYCELLEQI